jgi:BNR repeat-like domain
MTINPVYLFTITIIFLSSCSVLSPTALTQHHIKTKTSFGLLEISSFDIYTDDNTLHLLISGASPENTNSISVRYLKSIDQGEHWSNPVDIGTNPPIPLASRGNDVQIAARGDDIISLWQVQGEIPNNGPLVTFFSNDSGKSWQQGENPAAEDNGVQSHADLLVDTLGYFHVVWLSDPEENGYQSLRYSQSLDHGKNWHTPIKLDESTCSCCSNTLALSPNGDIHVLYRDMKPRDMTMLTSFDNGISWQNKKIIGNFNWKFDGCPHVGGGLTFDHSNNFYSSVWTGFSGMSGLYTISNSQTVKIGKNATHSDIIAMNDRIIVVWDEIQPGGTVIFSAQSVDNAMSWSTPNRLSEPGSTSTHPRIITSNNNVQVFWTEKSNNQPTKLVMVWID